MYQNFSIIDTQVDFAKSQILIITSMDVKPESVNDSTVQLFSTANEVNVNIKMTVEHKNIIIQILDEIVLNSDYILRVMKITNILDEQLFKGIRRKITFDAGVQDTVKIKSPYDYKVIDELKVELELKSENEKNEGNTTSEDREYVIQIASDVAFINIVLETTTNELISKLKQVSNGQYYIRARVKIKESYGIWSDIETFIMQYKDDQCSSDDKPTYTEFVNIKNTPVNGETPKEIIIEYDGALDINSIEDIVIVRRDI